MGSYEPLGNNPGAFYSKFSLFDGKAYLPGGDVPNLTVIDVCGTEMYCPETTPLSEVILASNSIWLEENAEIISGNIIVNNVSQGPMLDSQVELSVGIGVTTPAGNTLKANRIKVKQGAIVGSDIYYNTLINNGTINGSFNSPLNLPIIENLPTFYQTPSGIQDITVQMNDSISLAAGEYHSILVKQNGKILFTGGGTFAIHTLNTGPKTKIFFDAPSNILIEDKFDTDENSYVGPIDGSEVTASDIIFYVAGINGNNGNLGATPKAAQLGLRNTVAANFYVPNGTLWLRQGTNATGSFLGKDVMIGKGAKITLESAFNSEDIAKRVIEDFKSSIKPTQFELSQNYPNPFNPTSTIRYALPYQSSVELTIYDIMGREVKSFSFISQHAGDQNITWDGRNNNGESVSSGIYIYRLSAQSLENNEAFVKSAKMIMMK
jgi:hypothetical protein